MYGIHTDLTCLDSDTQSTSFMVLLNGKEMLNDDILI